ncbi:MAG: MFS transporter [Sulfobacillus acidophilus]|uniref:MFS transporter n=1 Tax=Sulfobacillus acidophilus TaxID=53633 RepID=A0A2T2WHC6_9FIRM|nr:MAG: MFS transporter [Sulfobacillus acidophilus]
MAVNNPAGNATVGRRSQPLDPSKGLRSQVSRERLVLILISTMLGMLLFAVDQTVVGTAMPRIVADLNGLKEYAWVTTAYLLTSTVGVPLYGKLSDIYGRKPFYLFGMFVFVLGSALSGQSHNMTQLILFRGLQGLGGGALMPIAIAIIGDIFPPSERGKWQGLLMAVFGFASILGPWAGGAITDHWGWRYVFYVNLPIGIIALIFCAFAFPSVYRRAQHVIDWWGTTILVIAATPMLLSFSWAGNEYTWGNWHVLGGFALSAVAWVVFIFWEMRHKEPIVEPRLFKNSIYAVSVLASFMVSAGMFGAIMFIPLFTQAVVGDSPSNSGIVLTPMMLGFMVSSIIGGQILSRTGRYKALAIITMAIAIVGMLLLSRMHADATNAVVIRNMVITGLGMGTGMSLFTIVVQNAFPFRMMGAVTAQLQFFRSIGSTVGLAVFGSFVTAHFTHELPKQIPAAVLKVVPKHALSSISNPSVLLTSSASTQLSRSFAKFGPQGAALAHELLHGVKVALALSTDRVFFLGSLLLAAALLTLFFLREIELKKVTGDVVAEAPSGPSLNRAEARAVLGLVLAKRAATGGFGDEGERRQARQVAAQLLAQYLAYQNALSVGEAEMAATKDS